MNEQHYDACRAMESNITLALSAVSEITEPVLVALPSDSLVFEPDEPTDWIYLVVDGVITLHTHTENGRPLKAVDVKREHYGAISKERFIEVGMANLCFAC